jgi:acetyl esterase/lipase
MPKPDAGFQTFRYGPSESQAGDLYLPRTPRPPVVCLLHGGFWRVPHGREPLRAVAEDLVARGWAVWNIGYRRLGEPGGGWPGTLQDAASAVDHLAGLDAALDLERVVVAGHSAGGQLALQVAAGPGRSEGLAPACIRPRAAAGLAAVVDLQAAWTQDLGHGAAGELLGGSPGEVPGRYAAASPLALLPGGPERLILHGTRDADVPVGLARDYVAAARAAGAPVRYVELPEAGHMDCLDPHSRTHASFCQWLEGVLGGPRHG